MVKSLKSGVAVSPISTHKSVSQLFNYHMHTRDKAAGVFSLFNRVGFVGQLLQG